VEALLKRPTTTVRRPRARTEVRDPNVQAAEKQLESAVGTRVRIVQNPGGAGRLELHFFSPDELERIYDVVLRGARTRQA
jgi:ParB family chromosome partitioning protein